MTASSFDFAKVTSSGCSGKRSAFGIRACR
jgi:hypothetical protein